MTVAPVKVSRYKGVIKRGDEDCRVLVRDVVDVLSNHWGSNFVNNLSPTSGKELIEDYSRLNSCFFDEERPVDIRLRPMGEENFRAHYHATPKNEFFLSLKDIADVLMANHPLSLLPKHLVLLCGGSVIHETQNDFWRLCLRGPKELIPMLTFSMEGGVRKVRLDGVSPEVPVSDAMIPVGILPEK